MTAEQSKFIEQIAPIIQKYAPQYQIAVCSPVIAQAVLESGWGKSKLSAKYHNYFGLKCGSKWTGKSVNMTTSEEYTPGTHTVIKDNFRVYDSMEEGVKGYFEFLQLERYHNLRGITDPETYLKTIKADGYATSSTYVSDLMKVIKAYDLTKYDKTGGESIVTVTEKEIRICGHGSGNPSIKNLYTYTATRYASKAPNGVHKGIACVRRLKAMTEEGREKYVRAYEQIVGRNLYSQARRSYVNKKYTNGKYYSDCSSSQMWALQEAGFNTGGLLNTAGIYNSNLFETVPAVIRNGHITNPEILKVADQILYIGSDPSRPKQIGHVEGVYSAPETKVKTAYDKKYPVLPERGYFKLNDGISKLTDKESRKQIKRVQKLVSWILGAEVKADGEYGTATASAVKKAQSVLKVAADGRFGRQTLQAARVFRK